MLTQLGIRNFVLAERIDLAFTTGLAAFTGETGAGKSILLDALALLCGGRFDPATVRTGAVEALLTATFDLPLTHPVFAVLKEAGVEDENGTLLLRRILGADGRSKAFINDVPASIGLLKQVGSLLVDIHGQFDTLGLLDEKAARGLLDAFGKHDILLDRVAKNCTTWRAAKTDLEGLHANREAQLREAEYLDAALKELYDLNPQTGEEDLLLTKRKQVQNKQATQAAYGEALAYLEDEQGVLMLLHRTARVLEKLGDKADDEIIKTTLPLLAEAHEKANEATAQLQNIIYSARHADDEETLDDRLYALRTLARKHNVRCDDLVALIPQFEANRQAIGNVDQEIAKAEKALHVAQLAYNDQATELSKARQGAAQKLQRQVQAELAPLKLAKAKFTVEVEALPAGSDPQLHGLDEVRFMVQANEGLKAGPLSKVASGGELSRFMLALKLVLGASSPVTTLVFDEIDSGMGGSTAAAIGSRLAELGKKRQSLIVTHAPQVAAYATTHLVVRKQTKAGTTTSHVETLPNREARAEELARMLAGQNLSAEARGAANKLLEEAQAVAA